MVWQAIGATALNFGANYLAGLQQYKYQRALQEQAAQLNYDYGQKSLLNSPGSTRKGLESAGYNPMLAVQNATSGANAGWTSAGTAKGPEYGDVGTNLIANAQSFQRLDNETKTAESTVHLNEANGRKAIAEAISQEIKNPFISQKEQSEINKMGAETDKLLRETSYMDALEENMKEQIRLGELGIDAQIYGHNMNYNASTYATNENNKTQRNIKHFNTGFGTGYTGYIDPDIFSSKVRPTSKYNNTGKSYHWEHY